MSSERFVLLTSHDTVLFARDGKLFHLAFPYAQINATVTKEESSLRSEAAGILRGLEMITVGQDCYALRSSSGYLCAELDGGTGWRATRREWETFRILALSDAEERLASAIDSSRPNFLRRYSGGRIPRIIHQTSYTPDPPAEADVTVAKLKSLNPEWDYLYWSEGRVIDFILREYGYEMLQIYLSINPRYGAARADLFRYLCIYHYGGVYLDIKSGADAPFSSLIMPDDEYLLSFWPNGEGEQFEGWGQHPELKQSPRGEYQQWHIISVPRHPFLESVINSVVRNIITYDERVWGVGKSAVLRLTGPIAYSLSIIPLQGRFPSRIFEAHEAGLVYRGTTFRSRMARHYESQTTPVVL